MADPVSYLLCGTPLTGSTLLCGLLASTGVAGRPESYFREPDEQAWARRLGVAVAGDGSFEYRAFVRAVRTAGSTPNGVFAGRVMWGTMYRIVDGLGRAAGRQDLDVLGDVLGDAFGPLRLVHLRRTDVVGQAVSWARAEQTGYWQDGDRPSVPSRYDPGLIEDLVRTIGDHEAAWRSWFAAQGVEPLPVAYEDVVADPRVGGTGDSRPSRRRDAPGLATGPAAAPPGRRRQRGLGPPLPGPVGRSCGDCGRLTG